jgi:hypothetical protein
MTEPNNSLAIGIQEFIRELMDQKRSFTVQSIEKKKTNFEFSVEYNAVRILVIVKYCSVNRKIDSQVKFTFYDFLLRFPICLKYILEKNGKTNETFTDAELRSIDNKMVKYVSSAWDPDYYNYLAFLTSRGLIMTNFANRFELEITELGEKTIEQFEGSEIARLIRRTKMLKELFSEKRESDILAIINTDFKFTVL